MKVTSLPSLIEQQWRCSIHLLQCYRSNILLHIQPVAPKSLKQSTCTTTQFCYIFIKVMAANFIPLAKKLVLVSTLFLLYPFLN